MESEKTNEGELTSTMDSFMSTSKEEKNDNSDSTPTSSTDAFTITSESQIAADDPISSTSSDVIDSKKNTEKISELDRPSIRNVVGLHPAMDLLKEASVKDDPSPIVSEKDLLDINITDTSTEKITENVDDLVQDLENLLGEPTTSFNFSIRPRDVKKCRSDESEGKNIPMDLDAISAELQVLGGGSTKLEEPVKSIFSCRSADDRDTLTGAAGDIKHSKKETVLTKSSTSSCYSHATSIHTYFQEDLKSIQIDSEIKSSQEISIGDVQSDMNKNEAEHEQSCQSEVVSASTSATSEEIEKTYVTSTDPKPDSVKEHTDGVSSQYELDAYEKKEDPEDSNEVISTKIMEETGVDNQETFIEEPKNINLEKVTASSEELPDSVEEKSHITDVKPTSDNTVVEQRKEDELGEHVESSIETVSNANNLVEVLTSVEITREDKESLNVSELESNVAEIQSFKDKQNSADVILVKHETQTQKIADSLHICVSDTGGVKHVTLERSEQVEDLISPDKELKEQEFQQIKEKSQDLLNSVSIDAKPMDIEEVQQNIIDNKFTDDVDEPIIKEKIKIFSLQRIEIIEDSIKKSVNTTEAVEVENPKQNEDAVSIEPLVTRETCSDIYLEDTQKEEININDVIKIDCKQEIMEKGEINIKDCIKPLESSNGDSVKNQKTDHGYDNIEEKNRYESEQSNDVEEKLIDELLGQQRNDEQREEARQLKTDEVDINESVSVDAIELTEKLEDVVAVSLSTSEGNLVEQKEKPVSCVTVARIEVHDSKKPIKEVDRSDAFENKEIIQDQMDTTEVVLEGKNHIQQEEFTTINEKAREVVDVKSTQEMIELRYEEESQQRSIQETEMIINAPQQEQLEENLYLKIDSCEVTEEKEPVNLEIDSDQKHEDVLEVKKQKNKVAEIKSLNQQIAERKEQEQVKFVASDQKQVLDDLIDDENTKSELASSVEKSNTLHLRDGTVQEEFPLATSESTVVVLEKQKEDVTKSEIEEKKVDSEDCKEFDNRVESESAELLKVPEDVLQAEIKAPTEISFLDSGIVIPSVDFISDNLDMPSHSLAEDLDLLVQNTVHESLPSTSPPGESSVGMQIEQREMQLEIHTASLGNTKIMQENVISNALPLDVVPDLDVLNAITSLDDGKTNLTPELTSAMSETDALLTSSSLEQSLKSDVTFESNIETGLPTVDDIFTEPTQPPPADLQDDNLETLLAVVSLQNDDYMTPEGGFATAVDQMSDFHSEHTVPVLGEVFSVDESPKYQSTKTESLYGEKKLVTNEQQENVEKENDDRKKDNESELQQKNENKLKEPLVINIEDSDKERIYSPKITIKPIKPPEEEHQDSASSIGDDVESSKGSLKMTITKQSDNTHSILKIYNPDDEAAQDELNQSQSEPTVPKLIIKPIIQPNEPPQSPKMSRNSKQVFSPPASEKQRSASPRITIKPIPKPEEPVAPLKITIKPLKTEESYKQKHSPKLTIKPIPKPEEEIISESKVHSPRVTIKPIVKPVEEIEQASSPRVTIKPIVKPSEEIEQVSSPRVTIKPIVKPADEMEQAQNPRVTIKPIVKPAEENEQVQNPRITIKPIVKPVETVSEFTATPIAPRVTIRPVVKPFEKEKNSDLSEQGERSSPKITIKPIPKPQDTDPAVPPLPAEDFEESIKERIVLKINKGTIPGGGKDHRKREVHLEEEKSEKLAKIKVKFSREGGHPQIVQDQSPIKRPSEHGDYEKTKRQRIETEHLPAITITPIAPATHSKLKEMLSRNDSLRDKLVAVNDADDEVSIVEETKRQPPLASPIIISEESNQDSMNAATLELRDPISEIPVFEITPESVKTINPAPGPPVAEAPVAPPAPRKRGRPRKVPLQVREDFKDPKEEEPKPVVVESTRPKRSCRGQSVRTTLGIKPRKPRGPGRGRGSKRGMGTRGASIHAETPSKGSKEPKLSDAKLNAIKEDTFLLSQSDKNVEIDDGLQKSPSNTLLAPPQSDTSTTDRADIVMYEEETRMSAETSSRAQTPAKQVVTTISTVDLVEESQSSIQSIQSTATTESVKVRRGPRLEVHQEPDGAVIAAEQLAEYYWQGGGPYMLQEQVAQFLGIKSFKRKYPNIQRRVVDMQERDFIRESGLAGEAMCDLGLTAVNSSDILDIMYSDFQDKYEEYCKHQRDRQAKDLTNKQRALSLAASQEKNKIDITQQAVQSAASWNASFNKTRREQRKACMDLQTLTVHYPKGKMKQVSKPKIGHYPVALVPGQYTDYYREFTPSELNKLPLNTVLYDRIVRPHEMECDSQTDGSGSDSDSSSSETDSSYSGSSDNEDCTICKPTPKRVAAAQ